MNVLMISGARDRGPTDGVRDYVANVGAELAEKGHAVRGASGSFPIRAIHGWKRQFGTKGPSVGVLQYTHLAWSRRGFPIRAAVIARLWRWLRYPPLVTVVHDPVPFPGSGSVSAVRAATQRWVMRSLLRNSGAMVVTIEPELIPWVAPLPPNALRRLVHLPVGSNVPPTEDGGRQRTGVFSVSVFGITEGHRDEADAIAVVLKRVAQQLGEVRIVLVGRGTLEAEPRIRKGLEDQPVEVECLGVVPSRAVSRALAATDALLFLRSGASTRRGSMIAGIANGIPIVAYEGLETGPLIRRSGVLLAKEGDTVAAADRLLAIATDPELREILAARNEDVYRRVFSWSAIASSYEVIMSSAAQP